MHSTNNTTLELINSSDSDHSDFKEINIEIDQTTRKILIIGEELAGRITLFNNYLDMFDGIKKTNKKIKLKKVHLLNKLQNFQIIESTGYEENSSKLEINELSSILLSKGRMRWIYICI